jgi:hypothetical protein
MKKNDEGYEYIYDLNNPIIKKLLKNSYLTHIQLEILLDFIFKKQHRMPIKTSNDMVRLSNRTVKRGTYYRILRQARDKLSKSIITLLLATKLDIISHQDVTNILEGVVNIDITLDNIEIYETIINMIKTSI